MTASLREYIRLLGSRGQLLTVRKEVDSKFEINAVVRKIQSGPNLPVLFEKVRGTRYPVIRNIFSNYGLIAQMLGVDIGRIATRWTELTAATGSIAEQHPADGAIKNMIFRETNDRLYGFDIAKRTDIGLKRDRFARLKEQYEKIGPERSNLCYGYVNGPVDWTAFA